MESTTGFTGAGLSKDTLDSLQTLLQLSDSLEKGVGRFERIYLRTVENESGTKSLTIERGGIFHPIQWLKRLLFADSYRITLDRKSSITDQLRNLHHAIESVSEDTVEAILADKQFHIADVEGRKKAAAKIKTAIEKLNGIVKAVERREIKKAKVHEVKEAIHQKFQTSLIIQWKEHKPSLKTHLGTVAVTSNHVHSVPKEKVVAASPPIAQATKTASVTQVKEAGALLQKPVATKVAEIKEDVKGILDIPVLDTHIAATGREDLDVSFKELQKMILSNDETGFRNVFLKLNQEKKFPFAADLAKALLENVSVRLKIAPESINNYRFVIRQLHEVYPAIKEYFRKFDEHYSAYLNEFYLSPAGVRKIVEHLQKNESLKLECIVCNTMEDFQEKLKSKLLVLNSQPAGSRCSFIVYNVEGGHFSPVYIEKDEQGYKAVVSDSLGRTDHPVEKLDIGRQWGGKITLALKAALLHNEPKINFHIYSYMGPYRQYDAVSCPIFSLRDLVKLSQYSSEILPWLQAEPRMACSTRTVSYVEELPSEMMKTTQSATRIREHIQKVAKKDEPAPQVRVKPKQQADYLEPLRDYIKNHSFNVIVKGEIKKGNLKPTLAFLKYERLIISTLIVSEIVSGR